MDNVNIYVILYNILMSYLLNCVLYTNTLKSIFSHSIQHG